MVVNRLKCCAIFFIGLLNFLLMTLPLAAQGTFTISASPASITIPQSGQGVSVISTTISGGFNSPINLSASGVPVGASLSFNPSTIGPPGAGSSIMAIAVHRLALPGTYTITVTGNGGGVQQNTTVTLTITAQGQPNFTMSAIPSTVSIGQGNQGTSTIYTVIGGGFNNFIVLSVTGTPAGTNITFNPNPIPAPGAGTSLMTINVGGNTPPGSYPLTVTGNGGGIQQTTPVTLIVTGSNNFQLSASPTSFTVQQGNQGNTTITASIIGGFNSAISLSASGAPTGASVDFNPNPIPAPGAGSSVMTVTVGNNTPIGTYPITVIGDGGGIEQQTTVTLTVTGPGSFTLSLFPPSVTIAQGNQGLLRAVTNISGNFNSTISLSVSGLPTGTTGTFNPSIIMAPGRGFSTLTLTVGGNTPFGSYTVTVTGTGGGIKQTATATLNVVFALDTYSGLLAAPVPGCIPTGYFQTMKVNGRWVYADPQCNTFYQRGVYDADRNYILEQILQQRYGSLTANFAKHSLQRITGWGFNATDIYYSWYMLPVPWENNPGAPIPIPFILSYNLLSDVWYAPQRLGLPEGVKNICTGFNSNGYNGFCSNLDDVFDPKFQTGAQAELLFQENEFTGGFNTDPWVITIQLGDPDYIFALKGNGVGTDGADKYPHAGMMVATVNFQFSGYLDQKLYSKHAWISFLQNKYGTIDALNASWNTGGFYTKFGDDGGFGDGTGVLDEDGRHGAWFGTDIWNRYFDLVGVNSNLVADMDQFLYQWTYQAFSVQVNTIRTYDQNHLFSCGPFGGVGEGGARPPVLQALKDAGCNVLIGNWNSYFPSVAMAGNQAAYDAIGLPTYLWYGITSQADSDVSNYPNQGATFADYPTQVLRGQHYATDQQSIFNLQGSDGDYYIVGTSFWSLTDNGSEGTNWGLISFSDNAYDGKCAVINQSIDQYGIACGGELSNYGDFLDSVTQTNANILQQVINLSQQ